MSISKLIVNPNFYWGIFLFSGRTALDKFNIPIEFRGSMALLFLGIILALLIAKSKPSDEIKIGGIEVLLLFFLFLSTVSIFYSPSADSYIKTSQISLMIISCVLLTATLRNKEDFYCLILGFVFIGAIFTFAAIPKILTFGGGRSSILGIGFNTVGRFTFIFIIATIIYLYHYKPKKIIRLYMFTIIGIGLMIIILSGSRGVYLATMVALVIGITVYIKNNNIFYKLQNKNNLKVIFSISVGLTVFFIGFKDLIFYFFYKRFLYLFSDVQGGGSVRAREEMHSEAISIFFERPILGYGLDGFAYLSQYDIYPHNLILEVASELGIIGLIVLTILLIFVIVDLNRIKRKSITTFALLLSLLCFQFISVQFSGDLYDSRLLFFTISLISVVAKYNVIPKNEPKLSIIQKEG